MRLPEYLTATGESHRAFARRAGVTQQTIQVLASDPTVGTTVTTARKIVHASREQPASGDAVNGVISYEELDPEYMGFVPPRRGQGKRKKSGKHKARSGKKQTGTKRVRKSSRSANGTKGRG